MLIVTIVMGIFLFVADRRARGPVTDEHPSGGLDLGPLTGTSDEVQRWIDAAQSVLRDRTTPVLCPKNLDSMIEVTVAEAEIGLRCPRCGASNYIRLGPRRV